MKPLDITEVARRSGVPASTLRFYEEKGLIASIGRRGLRRLFDARVVERLALLALGRASGFSLEEMAHLFAGERPAAHRQAAARREGGCSWTRRSRSSLRCATVCDMQSLAARRVTWSVRRFSAC